MEHLRYDVCRRVHDARFVVCAKVPDPCVSPKDFGKPWHSWRWVQVATYGHGALAWMHVREATGQAGA